MAVVIDLVCSVLGLLGAITVGLLWRARRPLSKSPGRFIIAVVVAYALASSWIVAYGAERLLTLGLDGPAAGRPSDRTAIVLLAASSTIVEDWSGERLETLSVHGAARLLEALRIYRQLPDAVIISSGGPPSAPAKATPNSVLMCDTLVRHGVPEGRVLLESQSRNTHDQAVRVAALLRTIKPERVVLVTSAAHMRRALGAFRAQGVPADPAMARNPFLTMALPQRLIPSQVGLSTSSAIAHEIIGLAYYAARGWLA